MGWNLVVSAITGKGNDAAISFGTGRTERIGLGFPNPASPEQRK